MTLSVTHRGLLDDEEITLDVAALELAALDHPDVDLEPYTDLLGEIADRLEEDGGSTRSAMGRAEVLSALLAGEYGLVGDRDDYDDSRNADLIEVLDRRRGLPVALSIIYAGAARRIGWVADVLNIPGHVLVRLGPASAPVLIDPFNLGRVVAPEQLAHLMRQMAGDTDASEQIAPMANRMVLVRLLTNQATRAETAGDARRARVLFERMTTIAPAYGHGWWERARLELEAGDVGAAKDSLSAMLEMTRNAEVRGHISSALGALTDAA